MDKGLSLLFALSAIGIVVFGAILMAVWADRDNYTEDEEDNDEWWG